MKPIKFAAVPFHFAICAAMICTGVISSEAFGQQTNALQSTNQQAGQTGGFGVGGGGPLAIGDGGALSITESTIATDNRRTSINEETGGAFGAAGGGGGANAFGGAGGQNPFQALFGGAGGFGQQFGQFGGGTQSLKSKVVRAPLVVVFERPASRRRTTQQIATTISTTFSRLPRFRGDAINASSVSGVMTLTGTVATQSKKDAAARVARMEPGVNKVVNMLTVIEPIAN